MRPYDNGVTVGIVPDRLSVQEVVKRMDERHNGEHDTLVVFVPRDKARDARDRIWKALEAAPTQDPAEFARDQALAYEGNIGRMYGSAGFP